MDDPKKGPRLLTLYERWSFMRGSNYKALTGKILIMDLLMGGGRLLEVVIHGSPTVLQCHVRSKYNIILNFINKPCVKFHITITSLGGN